MEEISVGGVEARDKLAVLLWRIDEAGEAEDAS